MADRGWSSHPFDGRLRAVLLLAGTVRRSALADAVGRALLDLPLAPGRSILDHWCGQLQELAGYVSDGRRLTARVAVDRASPLPNGEPRPFAPSVALDLVRDPGEYRGTAGVVRDLTREYGADDLVLVVTANVLLREPLAGVYAALRRHEEGVSLSPHGGGDLSSVFLLRCDRMLGVPQIGFVDLKEQALPAMTGRPSLGVTRRAEGSALPLRTLAEYVAALRAFHEGPGPGPAVPGPFEETWRPRFSLAEPGAHVHPSAAVQDSVVLSGGRVEAGATLVRSVVCDGGVVGAGECLVDALVTARA